MKKWVIALGACVVAAAAVLGWYLYPTVSDISVDRPLADTPQLNPLRVSASTISLPITIPIDSLEAFLNQIAPDSARGSFPVKVLGATVGRGTWKLNRAPIKMAAKGNKLHFTTRVSGSARYGATVRLAANVSASTSPRVRTDWRMEVSDLRMSGRLSRAELVGISLRSLLQPSTNRLINNLANDIRKSIANDKSLENSARRAWEDICGTFPWIKSRV